MLEIGAVVGALGAPAEVCSSQLRTFAPQLISGLYRYRSR